MKILQINVIYPHGSTGRICEGIYKECIKQGIECKNAYAYSSQIIQDGISITSLFDHHFHNRIARITMLEGCFSYIHTLIFLKKVKAYKPDIIHLHNVHGNYINIPLLVKFINKYNIATVLTTHDCWPFTGYCKHFTMTKCERWKMQCEHCPQRGQDSVNLLDTSYLMFRKKRKWFSSIQNLTLVTPSQWINCIAKDSFLKAKKSVIINNGINIDVFKPTNNHFREQYRCEDKFILLGVAFDWGIRKGLDVFIELSKRFDYNKYQIVLVGTNDEVDKCLPKCIISIHRTHNQIELAEIYTAADLFVNPTREEMFGLVNVEALACGTPGITFNSGGSPECYDSTCGSIVDCNDIDTMEKEIKRICEKKPYDSQSCIQRSKKYDMNIKFREYIDLYFEIMKEQ